MTVHDLFVHLFQLKFIQPFEKLSVPFWRVDFCRDIYAVKMRLARILFLILVVSLTTVFLNLRSPLWPRDAKEGI
jgi:hypothetical protein